MQQIHMLHKHSRRLQGLSGGFWSTNHAWYLTLWTKQARVGGQRRAKHWGHSFEEGLHPAAPSLAEGGPPDSKEEDNPLSSVHLTEADTRIALWQATVCVCVCVCFGPGTSHESTTPP